MSVRLVEGAARLAVNAPGPNQSPMWMVWAVLAITALVAVFLVARAIRRRRK